MSKDIEPDFVEVIRAESKNVPERGHINIEDDVLKVQIKNYQKELEAYETELDRYKPSRGWYREFLLFGKRPKFNETVNKSNSQNLTNLDTSNLIVLDKETNETSSQQQELKYKFLKMSLKDSAENMVELFSSSIKQIDETKPLSTVQASEDDKRFIDNTMLCAGFLYDMESREHALGDLIEKYDRQKESFGVRNAKLWLCWHVIKSYLPLLVSFAKSKGFKVLKSAGLYYIYKHFLG